MSALTKVYRDHPKILLYTSAVTVRLLLALTFPGLPDLLTGRVEISTPVNSFKRLQEGLFLYERGVDPYDGGIFHQAPLLLPLFALLPSPVNWLGQIFSVILYTALDVSCAEQLYHIAASGTAVSSRLYTSPRKGRAWSPASVIAVYLFNPYTILTCLGRPTTVFTTFFVLLSISHACQGKATTSAFALAIASYMSLHPALLLPPIGLLCYDQACQHQPGTASTEKTSAAIKVSLNQTSYPNVMAVAVRLGTTFVATLTLFVLMSRLLLPSWQFIPSLYLTPLQLPDLTPNSGLWWYFFTEMFDAFRYFFLGVFWLHMLSYSIPLCFKFHKQPLAAVVLMMGITAIFQPYANAGDAGAWLSSLCLLSHTFALSAEHRYTFPALAALVYCTLLGPVFHHLWIYAGSGNANFFYAITLVWNLGLLILLTDTLYACLRDEWESERPEGISKDVRQI